MNDNKEARSCPVNHGTLVATRHASPVRLSSRSAMSLLSCANDGGLLLQDACSPNMALFLSEKNKWVSCLHFCWSVRTSNNEFCWMTKELGFPKKVSGHTSCSVFVALMFQVVAAILVHFAGHFTSRETRFKRQRPFSRCPWLIPTADRWGFWWIEDSGLNQDPDNSYVFAKQIASSNEDGIRIFVFSAKTACVRGADCLGGGGVRADCWGARFPEVCLSPNSVGAPYPTQHSTMGSLFPPWKCSRSSLPLHRKGHF